MKDFRTYILGILAGALFLASCEKPTGVQLTPVEDGDALEIETIAPEDTSFDRPPFDSTAILPSDHVRFAGMIILNDIKYDWGQGIREIAFSKVLFENRLRPVGVGRHGYFGIPLGPVRLNGDTMIARAHRVGGDFAGVEYVSDLTATYMANSTYEWNAFPDSVGPINVAIVSPDNLQVLSPRGGARISRNSDLFLEWRGDGTIALIISILNPVSGIARPLLLIHPKSNRGHALLNRKVLRALPHDRTAFAFTFVLYNREESYIVNRFSGKVLVQAAAVYNTFVELL